MFSPRPRSPAPPVPSPRGARPGGGRRHPAGRPRRTVLHARTRRFSRSIRCAARRRPPSGPSSARCTGSGANRCCRSRSRARCTRWSRPHRADDDAGAGQAGGTWWRRIAPIETGLSRLARPGGGGGGGGLKEPAPPPPAERKGTSALRSPVHVRAAAARPAADREGSRTAEAGARAARGGAGGRSVERSEGSRRRAVAGAQGSGARQSRRRDRRRQRDGPGHGNRRR